MACCGFKKRMNKEYVGKLASAHSRIHEIDVHIFKEIKDGFGEVFDFEEVKEGRAGVVEVIKFRSTKSKNVLRDTGRKGTKPSAKEEKGSGRSTGEKVE
jgi:hypothetical protein